MRLTSQLLDHPLGAVPATYALAALMHLHAARLPARVDASGEFHSLFEQNREKWDSSLTSEGQRLLELSASGLLLTEYHVEAAIAFVHSEARLMEETNWKKIVSLYDVLMTIRPSPVVALNRAIAVAQSEGPQRGMDEIRLISDANRLLNYPFYFAALGEIELRLGQHDTAREHFQTALTIARNPMEKKFLERRVAACSVAAV